MNSSEINSQNINQTINLSETVTKDFVNKKEVYVGISDTGQGISSIILPRLFGKFVTDSDYGTGLGLYYRKIGGGSWWKNLDL
jgi:nitrogen fixation/metabolism regulation signal transduction histidine kinase